ncbi:MAG: UDP-N-acetylmuramate--L-alanine ligase [Bacteroidia bacterium]
MNLQQSQHTYFLGIGGIGMSALAHWRLGQGRAVSGYDRTRSVVTESLEKAGARIFYSEDLAHLEGIDFVVYTPAIPQSHIEFQHVLSAGIPMVKRAAALGELSKAYKTLAVAGTHGKTSTSAMLAHVLRHAGVDATAFLGGLVRSLGGNFVSGKSDWMVAEADEYDRSFLQLQPDWTVITALDPDHLDIYGSAENMLETYRQLGRQSGNLLVHVSAENAGWKGDFITYGIGEGDYQAVNIRTEGLKTVFDWKGPEGEMKNVSLMLPGRHNVLNATAALALAAKAGADMSRFADALASFTGIYRRFEILAHSSTLSYVDDYAHHPAEIEAAIQTARELFPQRKLLVVFQPHLYSRTRDFAEGFGESLAKADAVRLMAIYPARELPIEGVSSELILSLMPNENKAMVSREALIDALEQEIEEPTVVLSLGAGDIDKETSRLRDFIQKRISNHTANTQTA